MDMHVDTHVFLEIYVWICYGFSDQRGLVLRSAKLFNQTVCYT